MWRRRPHDGDNPCEKEGSNSDLARSNARIALRHPCEPEMGGEEDDLYV
jgi:hypothetical protein